MKASLHHVDDHGVKYDALMFVCPGCETPYTLLDGTEHTPSGLHMLPVNVMGDLQIHRPSWTWDGNLELPTVASSILSKIQPYDENGQPLGVCHSFLKAGVFEFLSDCTHPLAGQFVPMPDLPEWADF